MSILQFLFALTCLIDIISLFKIDQFFDVVLVSKPLDQMHLVLIHPPKEIVGRADTENTVIFACHYVDVIRVHAKSKAEQDVGPATFELRSNATGRQGVAQERAWWR